MNEPKASRYQRRRRRAHAAGLAAGVLTLAAVALTPAAGWLAGAAAGVAAGLPAPFAAVVETAVFVGLLFGAWTVAALPAWLHLTLRVEPQYRRDRASSPEGVVWTEIQSALLLLPLAIGVALVVRGSAWLAGSWWWLPAGLVLSGGAVAALRSAPGLVAQWSGASPIARGGLASRLGELARRAGVPIRGVLELPEDLDRTTALVAGVGPSRRVFVSADVARHWSDDEVAVVVAHEIGHHAHHDLWRTVGLDAAVLCAGLAASAALVPLVVSAVNAAPASLATLPLVAVVTGGVWLGVTPLRHAQSRRHERRADAFALALTGNSEAFDAAIRRLGALHLAEERPSPITRWLFHRHPSVAERLEYARVYRRHVA